MIQQRYQEQRQTISEEKQRSIEIDVRSIIMVYRERRGQTSTRIQTSREIMLTLNGIVANVSKNYESNQSINAGHIPACISADLFGAVLWLFSPVEFVNYQKKQLLADCYGALRPNKKLLTQYVESLRLARNAGEIDEKKFLFMRSHSVVYDALMNVTRGDYARFNERTYREVFDEIQEKAAAARGQDGVFAAMRLKHISTQKKHWANLIRRRTIKSRSFPPNSRRWRMLPRKISNLVQKFGAGYIQFVLLVCLMFFCLRSWRF